LRKDISKVLAVFPEAWSRSKKQYVMLKPPKEGTTTKSPIWLGRKYDFSPNGNKAKVEYTEDDIRKLETAPDSSTLQVRNDRAAYRFKKTNGKWVQVTDEI
jgi:hypothetical protein